ncbi:MAG: hypothetical protein JW706_03490 [Opitutales bacterium]|nr:hypothetical protein [Opitutales bacterium]
MKQITYHSSNCHSTPYRTQKGVFAALFYCVLLLSGAFDLRAGSETIYRAYHSSNTNEGWHAPLPDLAKDYGGIMDFSMAYKHGAFIATDHTLWGFGVNEFGELGKDLSLEGECKDPFVMARDVVSVAVGVSNESNPIGVTYYVTSDGRLWGLGMNRHRRILYDHPDDDSFLDPVVIDQDVVKVVTDGSTVYYLKRDGVLWGVGSGYEGKLGYADYSQDNQTRKARIEGEVAEVGVGGYHTVFLLKKDRSLWALGSAQFYDIGDVGSGFTHVARRIANDVKTIIPGGMQQSGYITMDDTLWVMGHNEGGMFGPSHMKKVYRKPVPFMENVQDASFYVGCSYVVKTDGTLWLTGTQSLEWDYASDAEEFPDALRELVRPTQVASSCIGLTSSCGATYIRHQGIAVYRFLNQQTNAHFFSANKPEYVGILESSGLTNGYYSFAHLRDETAEWLWETIPFFVAGESDEGSQPVYRMYNKASGAHFYTMSMEERDNLLATRGDTFQLEGVAFHAFGHQADGTLPVYRFYAPQTQSHFFTISEEEKNWIVANVSANDLVLDGIAWYCWPW